MRWAQTASTFVPTTLCVWAFPSEMTCAKTLVTGTRWCVWWWPSGALSLLTEIVVFWCVRWSLWNMLARSIRVLLTWLKRWRRLPSRCIVITLVGCIGGLWPLLVVSRILWSSNVTRCVGGQMVWLGRLSIWVALGVTSLWFALWYGGRRFTWCDNSLLAVVDLCYG